MLNLKFATLGLVLVTALATVGQADSGDHPPVDFSSSERAAAQNVEAGNQAYIESLIRKEVEARKQKTSSSRRPSKASSIRNCGKGYWKKSEALRSCPEATAMKALTVTGQAYFYCDCSED